MEFCGIHLTTILQAAHVISVQDISLKIIILKLWPHLPGANELKKMYRVVENIIFKMLAILLRPQWVKTKSDPLTHWPLGELDAILKLQF